MKFSFLEFFSRKPSGTLPISSDKLVLRMNRLLASEERVPLRELLQVVEECFAPAVLSIVYGEERSILATTGSMEVLPDIENVAYRIKDTQTKEYYLRSEVNGLYFRKGMHCMRVFPFSRVVNVPCFLLVEQEAVTKGDMSIDRVIDFLSIAVRLLVLTQGREGKGVSDGELLGRDAFVECLRMPSDGECYLGVFHFANMQALNVKIGMAGVDDAIKGASRMLLKSFPGRVCRISSSKIAVIINGEMYHAVCALQDVLDGISDLYPAAVFKCVTTRVDEDVYRILYLCERASETVSGDAVVVIRAGDSSFEEEKVEETVYYQTTADAVDADDIDDISYREIVVDPEEMATARTEYEQCKKQEDVEPVVSKVKSEEESVYDYVGVFDYGSNFED